MLYHNNELLRKHTVKYQLLAASFAFITSQTYALSGKVVDDKGQAIANASIEILDANKKLTTNEQGEFSFPQKQVDEIHIKAIGYSHKVLHLHDKSSESLTIVLTTSVFEHVDVIGMPLHLSTIESAQPVSVLAGDELRLKQASTLGETLKNEVGVHSSYFGPAVSSPIIRGLDGPRVTITQNGLDVGDASRVGSDHVIATEASTANQIEILRGPATLFYGSGAIGGVINVIDDRVPSNSEEAGAFAIAHNSVANEKQISAAYTGGNEDIAFHFDGFWRDADNYKIPGFAVTENSDDHDDHDDHDEHDDDHDEHDDQHKGVLANSAAQSQGVNLGASWLLDNGFVGLSYGRLERINDIIGHGHAGHDDDEDEDEDDHDDDAEEATTRSDLTQDRWQLISQINLTDHFLSRINTRIGYTDYQHIEVHQEGDHDDDHDDHDDHDEDGGTVFSSQMIQIRVDAQHKEVAGWRGALSLEAKQTKFKAVGAEAFTSPSKTEQVAIAIMEEKHIENLLWQVGARIENISLRADPIENSLISQNFDKLSFTPVSVSTGLVWDFTTGYNLGLSLTHAQRAPSAAEIYSVGPHLGTSSYDVGALFTIEEVLGKHTLQYRGSVKKEASNNLDISVRKFSGELGYVVNFFYNQVSNFYYQADTGLHYSDLLTEEAHDEDEGEHQEDLPIFIYQQDDATLYGIEAEFSWQITPEIKWTLWGDSMHAKLDNSKHLPRTPASRIGNRFEFDYLGWQTELSASHYFKQSHVADNESTTAAYTMIDLQTSYVLPLANTDLTLFAKISNLTDEEARVHTSFIKHLAPLPGRGISLGIRSEF